MNYSNKTGCECYLSRSIQPIRLDLIAYNSVDFYSFLDNKYTDDVGTQ